MAGADRQRARGPCRHRFSRRRGAYSFDRKLPLRGGFCSCAVRLHLDGLGAAARLRDVRRKAHVHDRAWFHDHRRGRLVRYLARAAVGIGAAKGSRGNHYEPPNALNVMMVWVSATPGMVCTFSAMKWPISIEGST